MRSLSAILGILGVLLLTALPARGTDYTWHSGYWWQGHDAYTRYYQPGYYNYGTYVPGYYYYQYSHTYTAPKLDYKDPNWRTKVLEIAKDRDEAKAFQDALDALGLDGTPYGGRKASYGAYAATASTQYGYSTKQLLELYGDGSAQLAVQSYSRAVENAQRLGGAATDGLGTLARDLGNNQTRIAEILARGQAASQALSAAQGQGAKIVTQTTVTGQAPTQPPAAQTPPSMPPADPPQAVSVAGQRWKAVADARCASCHTGASGKGGFDIYSYPAMAASQKRIVWQRLLSADPTKLMPRNEQGGYQLPPDELQAFMAY